MAVLLVQEYPDSLPARVATGDARPSQTEHDASHGELRVTSQATAQDSTKPNKAVEKKAAIKGGSKSLLSKMMKPKPKPAAGSAKPSMLPPGLRMLKTKPKPVPGRGGGAKPVMMPPGLRKIVKPVVPSSGSGTVRSGSGRPAMLPPGLRNLIKPKKSSQ